jgi:hypothetical protein
MRGMLRDNPLFNRNFRFHHGRDYTIHMIFVAKQTVLTRRAAAVAGLAKVLFHSIEIGHESLRIALFETFQIEAAFCKGMTSQTAKILQYACALTDPHRLEMRLMDEIREPSLFAFGRTGREIDEPPFAFEIVDAVAFRA